MFFDDVIFYLEITYDNIIMNNTKTCIKGKFIELIAKINNEDVETTTERLKKNREVENKKLYDENKKFCDEIYEKALENSRKDLDDLYRKGNFDEIFETINAKAFINGCRYININEFYMNPYGWMPFSI